MEPIADTGTISIQECHESTSLFQRPPTSALTKAHIVAAAILFCTLVTTGGLIVKWRDDGRVVVSLTAAVGLQLWLLTRILTRDESMRDLFLLLSTPEIYPLFAIALQFFEDKPSRLSAYVLLATYLVYFYSVAGFFNRSGERVLNRMAHPHFVPPGIERTSHERPPCYACLPSQRLGYNGWQFAKIGAGSWMYLMDLHISKPYNLLLEIPGILLIFDGIGEMAGSGYSFLCERSFRSLRVALEEEGELPEINYSTPQKALLIGKEILENYSLFSGSLLSGLALTFNRMDLLIPAGFCVGLHQHFAKAELEETRNWVPKEDPFKKKVSRVVGYTLAAIFGASMCAYAVVESIKYPNWLVFGSAFNMGSFAAIGFVSSRAISWGWDKHSGTVLTSLREHIIDNPVVPAYIVIVFNHVADRPIIARLGEDILGELGLSTASFLFASESARILDSRVIYRIIRISPAAAVVLGHMLPTLAQSITKLRW